jgi:hypothetical protein
LGTLGGPLANIWCILHLHFSSSSWLWYCSRFSCHLHLLLAGVRFVSPLVLRWSNNRQVWIEPRFSGTLLLCVVWRKQVSNACDVMVECTTRTFY